MPCCGLLTLPLEIRVEIYRYLFDSAELRIDNNTTKCLQCASSVCCCAFPCHALQICRQIRYEAMPHLFSAATLRVSGTFARTGRLPDQYMSKIPRLIVQDPGSFSKAMIDIDQLYNLKVLELHNIAIWCKYHDEAFLESPAADESMVGLALFNLTRISGQLKRLCSGRGSTFQILLYCQYVVSSSADRTIVCMKPVILWIR